MGAGSSLRAASSMRAGLGCSDAELAFVRRELTARARVGERDSLGRYAGTCGFLSDLFINNQQHEGLMYVPTPIVYT